MNNKDNDLEVYKLNKSVKLKLSNVRTALQFLLYSLVVAKVDNSLTLDTVKDKDLIFNITHKELLEQLEIKRLQSRFKKEIMELSTLQIEHIDKKSKKNEFILINVFSMIYYKNHILTIELNTKVKDYFIDLGKGNYLSYTFKTLVKFKSKYTMLLYELLKSDYFLLKIKHYFEYSLDYLLDKLQVKKSMRIYQNFKVKILEKALKEINEKTDLKIRYTAIKNAYTVDTIKFLQPIRKNINKMAREKEEQRLKDKIMNREILTAWVEERDNPNLFE